MQQEINALELYCAYSKCKVYNEVLGKLYELIDYIGIEGECLGLKNLGDAISGLYAIDNCKLALKPLSTISDEHLEMIARMTFAPYSTEIGDALKIERKLFEDGNRECNVWFKKLKIYFCLNVNHVAFMFVKDGREVEGVDNQVAIIDTLRLLGYDCGYMHIPSLIEDGRYAIDITKLQAP